MIPKSILLLSILTVFLALGCEDDTNLCFDYIEDINSKTYTGSISLDFNGTTGQLPVSVEILVLENIITLNIIENADVIYSADHNFRCTLLENETIPLVELLNDDNFVVGCISGNIASVLNYEVEVLPNALITTASTNL